MRDIIYSWSLIKRKYPNENNIIQIVVTKFYNEDNTVCRFNMEGHPYLETFNEFMSKKLSKEIIDDMVYIQFVDEIWGRSDYLLKTLIKVIQSCKQSDF